MNNTSKLTPLVEVLNETLREWTRLLGYALVAAVATVIAKAPPEDLLNKSYLFRASLGLLLVVTFCFFAAMLAVILLPRKRFKPHYEDLTNASTQKPKSLASLRQHR